MIIRVPSVYTHLCMTNNLSELRIAFDRWIVTDHYIDSGITLGVYCFSFGERYSDRFHCCMVLAISVEEVEDCLDYWEVYIGSVICRIGWLIGGFIQLFEILTNCEAFFQILQWWVKGNRWSLFLTVDIVNTDFIYCW